MSYVVRDQLGMGSPSTQGATYGKTGVVVPGAVGQPAPAGIFGTGTPFILCANFSPWMHTNSFEWPLKFLDEAGQLSNDNLTGIPTIHQLVLSTGRQDSFTGSLGEFSDNGAAADYNPSGATGGAYSTYSSGSSYSSTNKVKATVEGISVVAQAVNNVSTNLAPDKVNFTSGSGYYRTNLESFWRLRDINAKVKLYCTAGIIIDAGNNGQSPVFQNTSYPLFASNHENPWCSLVGYSARLYWAELGSQSGDPTTYNYTTSTGNGWGLTLGHGGTAIDWLLGQTFDASWNLGLYKGSMGQFMAWYASLSGGDPLKNATLDTLLLGAGPAGVNWTDAAWRGTTTNDASHVVRGATGTAGDLVYTSGTDNLAVDMTHRHMGAYIAYTWGQIRSAAVPSKAAASLQWGDFLYGGGALEASLSRLPSSDYLQRDNLMLDTALMVWKDQTQNQWWSTEIINTAGTPSYYPCNMAQSLRSMWPMTIAHCDGINGPDLLTSVATRFAADSTRYASNLWWSVGGQIQFTTNGSDTWTAGTLPTSLTSRNATGLTIVKSGTTFTITLTFSAGADATSFNSSVGAGIIVGGQIIRAGTVSTNTMVWTCTLGTGTYSMVTVTDPAGTTITPTDNLTPQSWIALPWGAANGSKRSLPLAWGTSSSSSNPSWYGGFVSPVMSYGLLKAQSKLAGGHKTNTRTYTAGNTYVQKTQDHSAVSYVANGLDSYWYERMRKQFFLVDPSTYTDALCPAAYSWIPPLWMSRYGYEWPRWFTAATYGVDECYDGCTGSSNGCSRTGFLDHADRYTTRDNTHMTPYESHFEGVQSFLKVARGLRPSMRIVPTVRALASPGSAFGYEFMAPEEFAYYWVRPWFVGQYAADGVWVWEAIDYYITNAFTGTTSSEVELARRGIESAFFSNAALTIASYWSTPTTANWDGTTAGGYMYDRYGAAATAILGYGPGGASMNGTHAASGRSKAEIWVKQCVSLWMRDCMVELRRLLLNPEGYPQPDDKLIGFKKPKFNSKPVAALVTNSTANDTLRTSVPWSAGPTGDSPATYRYYVFRKVSGSRFELLASGSASITGVSSFDYTHGQASGTQLFVKLRILGTYGSTLEVSNTVTMP